MKLTIIISDKAVYKDGKCYENLDLTSCNIPSDVRALQWQDTQGHIEFINNITYPEDITELPQWANDALNIWQIAYDAEQNAIAQAQKQAQSNSTTASTT